MASSVDAPKSVLSILIDRVISFFHLIAMLAVGVMAILLTYDIVMRYVFNRPSDWVLDVVQLVQVTLAFTAAAPVLKAGGHINMEVLQMITGKRSQRGLRILSNAICAVGSLLMVVLGWRTFIRSYQISESAYGITLPIYPWKFLVPLCFFILMLQFSASLLKDLKNPE